MKKVLVSLVVIAALTGALFGSVGGAVAKPSKSKSCASCHGTSSAVKIKLTKKSSTSTKRTYTLKITGGKGKAGWAVFSGGKNIKHKTSSKGTITLKRGKTYKIRAVKTGSGTRTKTFTVPK
jgi:hypothetical protein